MQPTQHALRLAKHTVAALGVLLLVLWVLSPYLGGKGIAGYAPLHTFLETLSIVVSAVIFMVWWSRAWIGTYGKYCAVTVIRCAIVQAYKRWMLAEIVSNGIE